MARPSVRNELIAAGMKLFIERGYNGCSVQDITTEAGVPKGSFYNHFASKEAMGAEAVELYGGSTTFSSILEDKSIAALTRIRKHFTALNQYFSDTCPNGCLLGKFMAEVSDDTPLIRTQLEAALGGWGSLLEATIKEGQVDGSIRKDINAKDMAPFLIDAYEGAILRLRVEKGPRALKTFVKIAIGGFLAPPVP